MRLPWSMSVCTPAAAIRSGSSSPAEVSPWWAITSTAPGMKQLPPCSIPAASLSLTKEKHRPLNTTRNGAKQNKTSAPKPPLCKGRWHGTSRDGGVVTTQSPSLPLRAARADCQPSATLSSKISAGVFQPRHFLGRLLMRSSII